MVHLAYIGLLNNTNHNAQLACIESVEMNGILLLNYPYTDAVYMKRENENETESVKIDRPTEVEAT